MTRKPDPIVEIVESVRFQQAIVGPMVDAVVRRLTAAGADGATSRAFLLDWLYLQRPMFERFRGHRFNVQFEGPPLAVDGEEFAIGCLIQREIEWARINPGEAVELLRGLRAAVDAEIENWMGGRPMQFLPATPHKPFPDRAAADAEAARIIRDALGSAGNPEGGA